ncbi:ESPR-type extended signal peptide-containing protein, partial [Haemophilus parahaemolyticus]|uniref:ESPR-type extended signal peptide-containing protein n=1 Tax=Haemophilus parahaemolyticus TaxID=735 RepID=UPI0028EFC045
MNKVFKVIWNHATQSWVAVSELTSAKGKTKSKKLTALSVAVGSALVGTQALAAVYVNNQAVTTAGSGSRIVIATEESQTVANKINSTTGGAKYDKFIRIGDASNPIVRDGDILIGFGINNQSTGEAGDTVIGNNARLGGGNLDSFSTGVGYRIQSAGPSVSIGVGARSDIGENRAWNGTENGGVAIGAYALQAGNKDGGVAIGAVSGGDYNYITSVGALSGVGGYQIDQVQNVGYKVNGGNDGATSIGYRAGARGVNSVALGRQATTANSQGRNAISVGYETHSIGEASVALGTSAVAGGFSASEITALETEKARLEGILTNISTDLQSAIGNLNNNAGKVSTVEMKFRVGQLHSAKAKAEQELNRIKADLNRTSAISTQSVQSAIAIGNSARANNINATAIGRSAVASAANSIVLGRAAGVTGVNSTTGMAIGDAALISGDSAVDSIAVGHSANIKQNSSHAIAIGANASVVGDLNGSSGSIAIGHNTVAGNKNAEWRKNSSRELGYLAAQNATAVGTESVAGGTNSTTFGYKNVVHAPNSGALGFNNIVGNYSNPQYNNNVASANYNGTDSFVVGANNNVTANNTVVFGNNVTVNSQGTNRTGAVVFGDNSTVPTEVKAVNSAKIGTENGKKLVYSGFAGNLDGADIDGNPSKATADKQGRFVSVGNATSPRQVKFVAAGEISATSTDAINGSQLYAFSDVVN